MLRSSATVRAAIHVHATFHGLHMPWQQMCLRYQLQVNFFHPIVVVSQACCLGKHKNTTGEDPQGASIYTASEVSTKLPLRDTEKRSWNVLPI